MRELKDCRVLVVSAELDGEALRKAQAAAEHHHAAAVILAPAGSVDLASLASEVTLLERPAVEDDDGAQDVDGAQDALALAADDADFAAFVADYAVRLDRGERPAKAFSAALGESAWEAALE